MLRKFLRLSLAPFAVVVATIGITAALATAASAGTVQAIRVTIENLAPAQGTFLTPVWVGFHDGTFDLYDRGAPASAALERIAEDGNTGPLSTAFSGSGAGTVQGTILGPGGPVAPGEKAIMTFHLDRTSLMSRYFSYASMIIPSNDAFLANGNPLAHRIFSNTGSVLGADFFVLGSQILDAGTEVNDEVPANTAFFGQMTPDTGVPQGGTVELHPGFIPGGPILSTPAFANANFLADGYRAARITVEAVPEPATGGLAAIVLGAAALLRRRRQRV